MALWRRSEVISTAWEPITSRLTLLPTSNPRWPGCSTWLSGRDGEIWVACGAGIFRVKDGAFQQWAADAPAWTIVQWVCEDSDGVVWGAQLTGIVRLKDNQLRYINRTNGLFDNNIYSIVPDDFGNLWVDSSRGIFRVSRKSMNDFADGKTAQVRCVAYDGPESSSRRTKPRKNTLGARRRTAGFGSPAPTGWWRWIPRISRPIRSAAGPHRPRPCQRHRVGQGHQHDRAAGQGELEFHFTALSFLAPQKVRFRYRLEGYDKDWVEAKDRRLAFLHQPQAGPLHLSRHRRQRRWRLERGGGTPSPSIAPALLSDGLVRFALRRAGACRADWGLSPARPAPETQTARIAKNRDLLEVKVRERTAELAKANQALLAEIGERKRAEEALATEQRLLNNLFTATPDIIISRTGNAASSESTRGLPGDWDCPIHPRLWEKPISTSSADNTRPKPMPTNSKSWPQASP